MIPEVPGEVSRQHEVHVHHRHERRPGGRQGGVAQRVDREEGADSGVKQQLEQQQDSQLTAATAGLGSGENMTLEKIDRQALASR